jgi:transposase
MDAAFYVESNLRQLSGNINWISRVPLSIKAAQELTQNLRAEQLIPSSKYQGYSFCGVCNEYAGIRQQWIVIKSEERKQADLKKLSQPY